MVPLKLIDGFLNKLTMYRLVSYGLDTLAVIAIALAYLGPLHMSGNGLVLSFSTLFVVCVGLNWLVGYGWSITTNVESPIITAMILGFIMPPPTSFSGWLATVLAGVIAIASKFLLAPYRKHIFNPAAFAAVVLGIGGLIYATWWVGSPVLLPFTIIYGLMILRKLHRFTLFGSFLLFSLATTTLVTLLQHNGVHDALQSAFTSSPLIFLGTVMLTEPVTMAPRRRQQLIYGAIVGAIFSAQLSYGRVSSTPELALILGNLYAYAVAPKYKLQLSLNKITQLSANVYDFAFKPDRQMAFEPGQYLEWTLHTPGIDSRGNRRTFSIASAPNEAEVHIGIKTVEPLRGFKKALLAMKPGDTIIAGQLGGDFVLPKNTSQKLVLVAGGIGFTPFRSMLQHLVLTDQKRDITLFYMVSSPEEVSYKDVLSAAAKQGVTVIPVLSLPKDGAKPIDWNYPVGRLSKELLEDKVPDYAQRQFYLSGPPAMVQGYKKLLLGLGLKRTAVTTDYFSGY